MTTHVGAFDVMSTTALCGRGPDDEPDGVLRLVASEGGLELTCSDCRGTIQLGPE